MVKSSETTWARSLFATIRASEPCSASAGIRIPAVHGEPGKIVVASPSATRRRRGSSCRAMTSVRQSKDCSRLWSTAWCARMTSSTFLVNVNASTVSSGAVGSIFVSMLNWMSRAP